MSIQPMKAGRRVLGVALAAAAMLGTTVVAQADFFDRPGFRGGAEFVEIRGGRGWDDDDGWERGRRHGWDQLRAPRKAGLVDAVGGHHRHHHHGGYRPYRGW